MSDQEPLPKRLIKQQQEVDSLHILFIFNGTIALKTTERANSTNLTGLGINV